MMPAGKYYVGDLCYVMHDEWDEFCDVTMKNEGTRVVCLDGEMKLADGRVFAQYRTAYGDGVYYDQHNREYGVDAGLIGCIKVDDIDLTNPANDITGGQVIDFPAPFKTGSYDGTIFFGDVRIQTGYDDEVADEDGADDE